jgi:hypothetical protein
MIISQQGEDTDEDSSWDDEVEEIPQIVPEIKQEENPPVKKSIQKLIIPKLEKPSSNRRVDLLAEIRIRRVDREETEEVPSSTIHTITHKKRENKLNSEEGNKEFTQPPIRGGLLEEIRTKGKQRLKHLNSDEISRKKKEQPPVTNNFLARAIEARRQVIEDEEEDPKLDIDFANSTYL